MAKITVKLLFQIITFIVLNNVVFVLNAQKLPKVQNTGLRAPVDIKVDGDLQEWNNSFQAYNTTNFIFYSLSNDENNLYLTLSSKDLIAEKKIIFGGVTLTVERPVENGKKELKSNKNISFTFPIPKNSSTQGNYMYNLLSIGIERVKDTSLLVKKKRDSIIVVLNKNIENNFTQIKSTGINGKSDSLISIFDSKDIKASARFDKRLQYNYELAIPLKYLGLDLNNGEKFRYNLKLNEKPGYETVNGIQFPAPITNGSNGSASSEDLFLLTSTDFWGKYILVKK